MVKWLVVFAVGVLVLMLGVIYWHSRRRIRRLMRHDKRHIGLLMLLALIPLAFLSMYYAKVRLPAPLELLDLSVPGVLFAIGLAILTVLGFMVTVSRVEDLYERIQDYPDLLERCKEIVEAELERVGPNGKRKGGKIWILANAPAFGNISAPTECQEYLEKLKLLLERSSVDVMLACHSWVPKANGKSELFEFYEKRWKDHKGWRQRVRENYPIIEMIRGHIGAEGYKPRRLRVFKRSRVVEAPFHAVVTSDSAILFNVLHFPSGDGRRYSREDKSPVKVIGFRTSDKAALREIQNGIENRVKHVTREERRSASKNQRKDAVQRRRAGRA